jgi:hypothetical protein
MQVKMEGRWKEEEERGETGDVKESKAEDQE